MTPPNQPRSRVRDDAAKRSTARQQAVAAAADRPTRRLPDAARLTELAARETRQFLDNHPESQRLAQSAQKHFLFGVPMHWMQDWPMPAPVFVQEAHGAHLRCVDGIDYVDFCLGDTAAMFGHSPAPVAAAIAHESARGLSLMMPGVDAVEVGEQLERVFGLPMWQDRKSTRLNSSHIPLSRMPSSA